MTFKTSIVNVIVLALALLVYRSCAARNLNTDPHAHEEIEKAKRK